MDSKSMVFAVGLVCGLAVGAVLFKTLGLRQLKDASSPGPATKPFVPRASAGNVKGAAFRWGSVESEDYRRYIKNMESIGMPRRTIEDVIKADLHDLYRPRLTAIRKEIEATRSYWNSTFYRDPLAPPAIDEAFVLKVRAVISEEAAALKELLGISLNVDELVRAELSGIANPLSWLPVEKQPKLLAELERLRELARVALDRRAGGGIDKAQLLESRLKLRATGESELSTLLTPEEKRQYDLRFSDTAGTLRSILTPLNVTQAEYERIFDIRKSFDDALATSQLSSNPPGNEPNDMEQRLAQYQQDLRVALGDERYREYQAATDVIYQSELATVRGAGLAPDTALIVYNIRQQSATDYYNTILAARLEGDQKQAALANLTQRTESALSGALGPVAYDAYRKALATSQSPSADWIAGIAKSIIPGPKKSHNP